MQSIRASLIAALLAAVFLGCSGSTSSPAGPTCGAGTHNDGNNVCIPDAQIIWQNGVFGCWLGDCATGAIGVATQTLSTTTKTSATNMWEIDPLCSSTGCSGNGGVVLTLTNAKDMSNYAHGHLEFDITLGSNVSALRVSSCEFNCNSTTALDIGSLSTSRSTHITVPLAGALDNLAVFTLGWYATSSPNAPIVYLNNIKWTTN